MKEVKLPKLPQKLTVLLLLVIIAGSIPLTLFVVQQVQDFRQRASEVAWATKQSAKTVCVEGTNAAIIEVSFSNTERDRDMDVVAKDLQTGESVDMGTVKDGETKKAKIETGQPSLLGGSVLFTLTWTDGERGDDTRTAIYQAINDCPGPPPTTPTPPMCTDNEGYCRWDLIDNAVSYNVVIKESKTGKIIKEETVQNPASQSAFLMERDKAYFCSVKANNPCGTGSEGKSDDKACIKTSPTPPPVCVPQEGPVKEAVCTWNELEGAAEYNIIIIDKDGKQTIKTDTVKAPHTKYVFPAEPGKTYQCSVVGVNQCGTGPEGKGEKTCPMPSSTPTPTPSNTPTPTVTKPPVPTPTNLPTPTTIVRTVTRTINRVIETNTNTNTATQTNTQTNSTNTQTNTQTQQQVAPVAQQTTPAPTIAPTGNVSTTAAITVASVGLIILGTLLVFIF